MNPAPESARSLADLHARLHACRLCLQAGYEIYPRAIFSGGMAARLMVIGQAPGITEKEAGRPFNAGSGTRLFQWLAQAGIEEAWFRRTQYMTAVTKCYPGRARSGSGDRVPSRKEQQLCRPYLEQEVALIDPALILPVGRLAIGLFYPPDLSLEEIIGSERQMDGRWIVPLPHPSGASRWHQSEANRQCIRQAVERIRDHLAQIFPDGISAPA
ncbi:MAG: uracil-DNA glycosylase family protein [Chloroflexota bacterium]